MSYADNYDEEELFSNVATIDIKRKKKVTVKLQDKDGELLELKEVVAELNRYITDQLKREEDNKLRDEIFPLISQVCMSGMGYALGSNAAAAFVASQEILRAGTSHLMMLSFYFLKFIQKNDIEVLTEEEDVTDEEIEKLIRISRATSTATLATMMGMPPREILRELVESGQITSDDLKSFNLGDADELLSKDEDEKQVSDSEKDTSERPKKGPKTDPNVN